MLEWLNVQLFQRSGVVWPVFGSFSPGSSSLPCAKTAPSNKEQAMNTPPNPTESIQRLERLATLLQQEVALLRTVVAASPAPTPPAPLHQPIAKVYDATPTPAQRPAQPVIALAPPSGPAARPPKPVFAMPALRFDALRSSEFWLNKVGIGLLLLGVAFLFKYSVDQGWLTPAIRCVVGLLIGGGLLGLGLRVPGQRREFGHVLVGGGIATFYITGFAAFQWYNLIAHPLALLFMSGVTVLAFALAVRRDAVALAVIGALGGLGTPFLLNNGSGSVTGLMAYLSVLLAGIGAIYLFRGWRSLWVTAFAGGWTVIALAGVDLHFRSLPRDHWAVQLGILVVVAVLWAVPVLREVLRAGDPKRWSRPSLGALGRALPVFAAEHAPLHVLLGTALTPFIALGMTQWVWELTEQNWGILFLLAATIYGVVCMVLYGRVVDSWLAYGHALLAALLTTTGAVLLLNGDALLVALGAQALVLLLLGRRFGYAGITMLGHGLWVVLGVRLMDLLSGGVDGPAIVNGAALGQLAVISLAVASSFGLPQRQQAWVYRIVAYVALLAWFGRELAVLPNGNGYVSVAWGGLGIAALVAGLRRDLKALRVLGMGTLALVVAKLFLVDLVEVEAIWRILLFIGFGVVFLLLSYFLQNTWRPEQPVHETE